MALRLLLAFGPRLGPYRWGVVPWTPTYIGGRRRPRRQSWCRFSFCHSPTSPYLLGRSVTSLRSYLSILVVGLPYGGGVSVGSEGVREKKEAGGRRKSSPKRKEEAMRARGLRYGALTPLPAVSQKQPKLQRSRPQFWGETLEQARARSDSPPAG